jgi:hypothetical protein
MGRRERESSKILRERCHLHALPLGEERNTEEYIQRRCMDGWMDGFDGLDPCCCAADLLFCFIL